MRALSAQDILEVWERGQGQHPLERAIGILRASCPEESEAALAELPIGSRDDYLLRSRELTFGSRLAARAPCPACGASVELSFSVGDIRVPGEAPAAPTFEFEGGVVSFRLPNSYDLAAAAREGSIEEARRTLAQRCLASHAISDSLLEALSTRISELDPQADILISSVCPECGREWQAPFAIDSFFWTELEAEARRLLMEVHRLAAAYSWSEADILSMSSRRRRTYLEMAPV